MKDDELKRKTKEVKMHSEDDDDDWSRISSVAGYSEKEKPKKEPTEETTSNAGDHRRSLRSL